MKKLYLFLLLIIISMMPWNTQAATLTNNYNGASSTVDFLNSAHTIISSVPSIQAWGEITIPSDTYNIRYKQLSDRNTFSLLATGNDMTVYTNNIITNTTPSTFILHYYPAISGTCNPFGGIWEISPGQSIFIGTGVTSVSVLNEAQSVTYVSQQGIASNSSYIINGTDPSFTMTAYTPTLTNNYIDEAMALNFYDSNSKIIATDQSTIDPEGGTVNMPANAYFALFQYFGVDNITIPIFFPYQNLFTGNIIIIDTMETIGITYYGNAKGYDNIALNSPTILTSNESIPILTGALNVSALDSSGQLIIPETELLTGLSYIITKTNGIWTISPVDTSSFELTNNYNQEILTVKFYDNSSILISTINSLQPWNSTPIPYNTASILINQPYTPSQSGNFIIETSTPHAINIYSDYVITNSTSSSMIVTCYYFNGSSTLESGQLTIEPYTSMQMVTGITALAVYDIHNNPLIFQTPIVSNSSYIIDSTPSLTPYIPQIFNNGPDATSLNFYNAHNSLISSESIFNAQLSIPIPGNTVAASLTDIYSNLYIDTAFMPLTLPVFINNSITNIANQTVYATFYGSLNGLPAQVLNPAAIAIPSGTSIPIITGANYVSATAGNIVVIAQTNVLPNTSYFINEETINGVDTWTCTSTIPLSSASIINNTGQAATNFQFFNANNYVLQTDENSSIASGGSLLIPETATIATFSEIFDAIESKITIPVSDTATSYIFESYVINNDSQNIIHLIYYSKLNGSTILTPLNTNPIPVTPTVSNQIITGAQAVSVFVNGIQVITEYSLASNESYFVSFNGIQWIISPHPYVSSGKLYNNNAPATNLDFFDNTDTQIGATINSFPSSTSVNTPVNAVYTKMTVYNSRLTIPVSNNALTNVFTFNTINNNTQNPIDLIFNGTINESLNPMPLNNPAFSILPTITTPIPTGSQTVTLVQNGTTYPIVPNSSYYINYINGAWSFNAYTAAATLTNNYNIPITKLVFNNASNTAPSTPQSVGAADYAPIPTNSTTAQFTDFNAVAMTIPVSDATSSDIFVEATINNTTAQPIGITFYGTINGAPHQPLNQSPITIAENTPINILKNTTSLTITVNNIVVIDSSTLIQPLPINISYDIDFSNNTWSIVPSILTLTNNCNEQTTSVIYKDADANVLPSSYTTIQPWATIPIPANALSAVVTYPSGRLTLYLSTETSSKIFMNSLLINNTTDDFYITMTEMFNNINLTPLNNTPLFLQAGDSFPFISGTSNITIIANNIPIISDYKLQHTGSYEIQSAPNSFTKYNVLQVRAITAAPPIIESSSSAIGVIRFLGGSTVEETTSSVVNLYGQNANLFSEFLYVNLYAQIITDASARTATITSVNDIITNYASSYANQPNFNYISYFYLINDQLLAAQTILLAAFPSESSYQQINQFFTYLKKRMNRLLV